MGWVGSSRAAGTTEPGWMLHGETSIFLLVVLWLAKRRAGRRV